MSVGDVGTGPLLRPPVEEPLGPPQRLGGRGRTVVVTGVLCVLLTALVWSLPAPYAIYAPGPVTNVLGAVGGRQLLAVDGHASYPAKGTLDMTTVEVYGGPGRKVTLQQVLSGWLSRSRAVLPEEQVFPPGQSEQQVDTQNAQEMTDSQTSAAVAGLREAGIAVPETIDVAEVSKDAPAAAVLAAGDVITSVDGTAVADSSALRTAVAAKHPGDRITLGLRRSGAATTVTTTTTQSGGRTVLGIGLDPKYRMPFQVRFGTKDVGGPSAGMMFALGIYDLLTPGELTGGQRVAGTGTIDGAGTVGPIGGIAQKMVGARQSGARWFLAPADNCGEVVGNVPDGLRVVRTASLHESRLDVEAIAAGRGASLPTCTK